MPVSFFLNRHIKSKWMKHLQHLSWNSVHALKCPPHIDPYFLDYYKEELYPRLWLPRVFSTAILSSCQSLVAMDTRSILLEWGIMERRIQKNCLMFTVLRMNWKVCTCMRMRTHTHIRTHAYICVCKHSKNLHSFQFLLLLLHHFPLQHKRNFIFLIYFLNLCLFFISVCVFLSRFQQLCYKCNDFCNSSCLNMCWKLNSIKLFTW